MIGDAPGRPSWRRGLGPVPGLALAALLLASCYEEPVVERLVLLFDWDGSVQVAVSVEIGVGLLDDASPALRRRLEEAQGQLLTGDDPWSRRFALLTPQTEAYRWEKQEGRLSRVERTARLASGTEVEALFAETGVAAVFEQGDGWASLSFFPGASTRANRRQQRQVADALDAWSEALADYFSAAESLYRYLDRRPQRATRIFRRIFEAPTIPGDELDEEEEDLTAELDVHLERVLDVLVLDEDEAYSLDGLSRLVYDPFPALLSLTLPGEILENEGFSRGEGTSLTLPGLSLWQALGGLEGRWLVPDPALAYAAAALSDQEVDLTPFVDPETRRALPAPTALEVRRALEELLEPAGLYRVRWRMEGLPRGGEEASDES